MAEADHTLLSDSLDLATVRRFVTTRIAAPNGGGSFVFGFNSRSVASGASGFFSNQTNFAPASKGGQITMAMQRGPSGGPTNFAPMIFLGLQGPSVDDNGYLLGLGDADPSNIVLKKGPINEKLSNDITGSGILAKSTASYELGDWVHLRLDMVVNLTGEVVLLAFQNDLSQHTVASPTWAPIPGMDTISPGSGIACIDDPGGVATGSLPYLDGRSGFAVWVQDVSRRCYFDYQTLQRQL